MQHAVKRATDPNAGPVIETERRTESAPVYLGVEWGSRADEFRTSLRDFFTGPRPSKTHAEHADSQSLKIEFIDPRVPVRGFVASCVWHVAVIWLLVLPIWGFLPKVQPTLQPPQIELTWYTTPADLPRILLPTSSSKTNHAVQNARLAAKRAPAPADAAFHPRQSILSVPVRETHPRQTLIEPDAPPEPPKVAPALPNVVQWAASEPPKLQLQAPASNERPRIERRELHNTAAPEIADSNERGAPKLMAVNSAELNLAMPMSAPAARAAKRHMSNAEARIAPAPQIANIDYHRTLALQTVDATQPKLAMPMNASTAMAAKRRAAKAESLIAPAPEVGASHESDASLRRLIALSSTPALPAPRVIVPKGNLAARIAMSPEGLKPGSSSGSNRAGAGEKEMAAEAPMEAVGRLPTAISVTGGTINARKNGVHSPKNLRNELGLAPFSRTNAASVRSSAPVQMDLAHLNPSLPPETILSGKQIYTMDVSLPNVTSASGSWILNFAQLDSGSGSRLRPQGTLSGPTPIVKVDPKYPPELIREHVQGEVILYAIIRKNGSVDSIEVMRSLDPQLDRDAETALAQWKFHPGSRAGVPVDIEAVVHIPFNYRAPSQ
jgi:TonB family protein